jgi:hypothetical protein
VVKRIAVTVYAHDRRARTAASSVFSLRRFFLFLPLAVASVRHLGGRLLAKARPKCEHLDEPDHRNVGSKKDERNESVDSGRHDTCAVISPILYFLIPFLKEKHSSVFPSVDAGEAAVLVSVMVTIVTHAKHKKLFLLAFSAFSESCFPVFVVLAKRCRCVLCRL